MKILKRIPKFKNMFAIYFVKYQEFSLTFFKRISGIREYSLKIFSGSINIHENILGIRVYLKIYLKFGNNFENFLDYMTNYFESILGIRYHLKILCRYANSFKFSQIYKFFWKYFWDSQSLLENFRFYELFLKIFWNSSRLESLETILYNFYRLFLKIFLGSALLMYSRIHKLFWKKCWDPLLLFKLFLEFANIWRILEFAKCFKRICGIRQYL